MHRFFIYFSLFLVFHLEGQESYHPNGSLKNRIDEETGDYFEWNEDGVLVLSGYYQDEKPVKTWFSYHPNGVPLAKYAYNETGTLHGDYTEWYKDGSVKSKSHYQWGVLCNKGDNPAQRRYHGNGALIEESHSLRGRLHGRYSVYHPESRELQYQVSYSEGKKHGLENYYSVKGKSLGGGIYQDGRPVGEHRRHYPNGQLAYYAKYDRTGEPLQPVEEYFDNGKKAKVHYEDKGETLEYYLNGKLKRRSYRGVKEEYYSSGKPKLKAYYIEGQLQAQTEWHSNGNKKLEKNSKRHQEWYVNGKEKLDEQQHQKEEWYPDGTLCYFSTKDVEKSFYPDGRKESLTHRLEGEPCGASSKWYEDGTLKQSSTYANGQLMGVQSEYYPCGRIARKIRYQNGQRHGKLESWHFNGEKESLVHYQEGLLHGEKQRWSSKGELIEKAHYDHGKLEGDYFRLTPERKEIVAHYKNHLLEGPYIIYNPQEPGKEKVKALEKYYRHGRLEE